MRPRATAAAVLVLVLATGCVGGDRNNAGPDGTPSPTGASRTVGPLRPDPALVGAGDPLFPALGNGGYDIGHYDLDLSWAPATKALSGTLAGTATLTATALRTLTTFDLDLAGLVVSRVTVDGATARFQRDQVELVISPTKPVPANTRFTVAVTYSGEPGAVPYKGGRSTGQLGWLATSRTTYTTQEPYGAHGWYPCSDHPSDKATYTIRVTAPSELTVVANGIRTERRSVGAMTQWSYHSAAPMASYLVTLAIGTYSITTGTGPHGLPLTYAYFPSDAAKALPLLQKSPAQISYFEFRFGPYPFASYGVLVNDVADDQTMETQTMVTLGRGLATDSSKSYPKGFGESVLAHELAHQWFGDAVTPTRWTDIWLNEGWAQYAQALYEADVLDQPLDAKMTQYRDLDKRFRAKSGPPGRPQPGNLSGPQVYFGPAVMLHGLREQMGDAKFFAMANAWVHDNLGKSRTRADFTSYVRKYAGRDLSRYMAGWLDSATQPAS